MNGLGYTIALLDVLPFLVLEHQGFMRADFFGRCLEQEYSGLVKQIEQHLVAIPPMRVEELRAAIQKPAERAGHSLDEAMISLLLEQTEGREGALPLLQFVLTRIWEGLKQGIDPAVTLKQIGASRETA